MNDIEIFYNLLLNLNEDDLLYHLLKYPDNQYIEFAKNLYNIKLIYPSVLLHPVEFLNLNKFYCYSHGEIITNDSSYDEYYMYESQFSYFDRFVFGLKKPKEFHFEYYRIHLNEHMYFSDVNDAMKYMEDIND